jgi:hypothetical protein
VLTPGDVVVVTRIDRLARSTFDLFAIVRQIVEAGAQFRSLAEPWADTSTSTGRLMLAVESTGLSPLGDCRESVSGQPRFCVARRVGCRRVDDHSRVSG